jgi:hypothetical protein
MRVLAMPKLNANGVRTRTVRELKATDVDDGGIVVFAASGPEDRSTLPVWRELSAGAPDRCVAVLAEDPEVISVRVGSDERRVLLKDAAALGELFRPGEGAYIDISGLSHHVWAPLLRVGLGRASWLRAIYAEPTAYRRHPSPSSATVFHLSESFRGIYPLPGFARLTAPESETSTVLVTFLGFEGMRARHIAMTLDSFPRVVPVVGLPGFQLDLPSFTVCGNREFLDDVRAFADIRFCRANCPFRAYQTLTDIRTDNPACYMYIAPVGTKPHALGAVLFALDHPGDTELVYDHPVRSKARSTGIEAIHVYDIR